MTETRPSNPFVAFLRFCWRALDFSRRLVLNAIFLLILVIFFAAIASGVPKLQPKTALLLAPHGDIVEQYTANPADRAFSRVVIDHAMPRALVEAMASLLAPLEPRELIHLGCGEGYYCRTLAERLPGVHREAWAQRLATGHVFDDAGQPVAVDAPIRAGQLLHYYRDIADEAVIPFDETILFQDDWLVVADKPHFLPVTPTGSGSPCASSR